MTCNALQHTEIAIDYKIEVWHTKLAFNLYVSNKLFSKSVRNLSSGALVDLITLGLTLGFKIH